MLHFLPECALSLLDIYGVGTLILLNGPIKLHLGVFCEIGIKDYRFLAGFARSMPFLVYSSESLHTSYIIIVFHDEFYFLGADKPSFI